MLLLKWQLLVFLGVTSLVLLYDLIVLIALGSSYMLPYLPGAVTLSCAGASLIAGLLSLVYVCRAFKVATLTPLVWLSLLQFALLTAIAVAGFMHAHDPNLVTELTLQDLGFLHRVALGGAYYPTTDSFHWSPPQDVNCSSMDNMNITLKQRFDEAYCAKRGHVFCDNFPMRAVLRFGLINATSSATKRIASAAKNATFFDVPMTNSTTLTDFCDRVEPSVLTAEPTLSALCEGCQRTREASGLGDWIDGNCVRNTKVDGFSTFCIFYRSKKVYPEMGPACRYATMKSKYDATFADICYHTTFPAKVQHDAKALATSAVAPGASFVLACVLLCCLQCSRDSYDEEDELMYGAICDAERAAANNVGGDVVP